MTALEEWRAAILAVSVIELHSNARVPAGATRRISAPGNQFLLTVRNRVITDMTEERMESFGDVSYLVNDIIDMMDTTDRHTRWQVLTDLRLYTRIGSGYEFDAAVRSVIVRTGVLLASFTATNAQEFYVRSGRSDWDDPRYYGASAEVSS